MVSSSAPRSVSGKVAWPDGSPHDIGTYSVQAFDIPAASSAPQPLGKPVALAADGRYRIPYRWTSTAGRNGPNLLVQVVDPSGQVVGEARRTTTALQATLNVTLKPPGPPLSYSVRGTVRLSTGAPLAGATVQIVDWDRAGDDPLVITRTGADGTYAGQFKAEQFRSSSAEVQGPDLIVRVFNAQGLLLATSPRRGNAQAEETIDLTVQVLQPSPDGPGHGNQGCVVRGQVLQAQGLPLAGVEVRAFDRDLRQEQLLGQHTTDAAGHYAIPYSPAQFRRAEKERADLLLRLFTPEGQPITGLSLSQGDGSALDSLPDTTATPSPGGNPPVVSIWFNAPATAVVNIRVNATGQQGPSELERHLHTLQPLLENLPLAELTAADIAFLSGETGIDAEHLAFLWIAAQVHQQTQLPSAALYGLFRRQLPTNLALLLVRPVEEWRDALQQAIAANIIPASPQAELDAILSQLQQLLPRHLAQSGPDPSANSFGALLATVLPDTAVREEFIRHYAGYDGQNEDAFWQQLASQPAFRNGEAAAIRFTLQVEPLSFGHLPLVRLLQQEQAQGGLRSGRDLARLDEAAWRQRLATPINGQPVGAPPGIPGANADEQQANFARALSQLSEALFPTAAFAARVAADTSLPQAADLRAFFTTNPDFDLAATPLALYMREKGPAVLAGVRQPETIAAAQRLFKLAPRYALLRPLLAGGLSSAQAIRQLGERPFLAQYASALGGTTQARLIYRQAIAQSARSLALVSRHHAAFDAVRPWVIPGSTPLDPAPGAGDGDGGDRAVAGVPDLQTLFGSLSSCQCQHCQSIYSPAAYLVDGLQFLREAGLLDAFQARRPDICRIELSCANTHTPLPFIDLTNEVLERALLGSLDDPAAFQTTRSAEELLAAPEHLHERVYDADGPLQDAVYPQVFPFNLWRETARVYLTYLGTSQRELIDTFQAGPDAALQAARAALNLSPEEAAIITTAASEPSAILRHYTNPADLPPGATPAAIRAQLEALQALPTLMHRTQLSFEQLLECLASSFINPGGVVALVDPASCDLSRHRLRGAGPDFFDRLHRFLRLRRSGPWSIPQLDQILNRLGEPASATSDAPRLISDTGLVRLMHLLELQRRLPLPLEALLSLWNPTPAAEEDPSAALRDKEALLARALRLRPAELLTLRQISGIDPFAGPEHSQTFLGHVDLVKRSGVLVPQLAYLCLHDSEAAALLAPDRQAIAAVCRTLRAGLRQALPSAETPRAPGDQLRAALTAELGEPHPIHGLNPSQIEVALALLRENWSRQSAEARADAELRLAGCFAGFLPFPEALTTLLGDQPFDSKAGFVLEPLRQRQLRRKLEAELLEFLPAGPIADALDFLSTSPTDSEAHRARLRDQVPLILPNNSFAILLNPTTTLADKFVHLLSCLQTYRLQRDLISQALADHLKLEESLVRLLLERLLQPTAPPLNREAIADLRALATIEAEDEAVAFITPLLIRLHKIAELCRAFKLSTAELAHFNSLGEESIDLNRIPFAALDPENPVQARVAMAVFGDWLALLAYRNLRDALPTRAVPLIAVLSHSGDDQDALRRLLVEATGWALDDLGDLSTRDPATDPRRVPVLQQRWRQISLSRRLGIGLPQLLRWAQEPPSSGQAQEIREAARAKVDAAQWLTIVRPLEDQLRERRRDALVAYLLHHPELWRPSATRAGALAPTTNQLYEHFLIDVEMSACQLTSRIRQAIAAVQLFIQRCQMGLEDNELPNELSRQWETWRKTYRYWEANRKVFLYPENWIEPELRDDKTPFFKDLENALLQNEVTEQVVEDAYFRYLTQLNEVARLEIMGLYVEKEAGVDVLHVFGRTPGIPHHYYYRRRINSRIWTAWEKVELDIEGDHLIPVVWNRRLHLFWPIFTEKAVQKTTISESEQGTAPLKYWEIGLACSEYRNKQWKAKTLISGKLDWPTSEAEREPSLRPQKDITFKAFVDPETGALLIFCFSYYREIHSILLVPLAAFLLQGCTRTATITLLPLESRLDLLYGSPLRTQRSFMRFEERENSFSDTRHGLYLPNDEWDPSPPEVFRTTPGPGHFTLQPAHQYPRFNPHKQPFFFQDGVRTFFITHEVPLVPTALTREKEAEALPRLRESLSADVYGTPGGSPVLPGIAMPPLSDPIGMRARPTSDPDATQPLRFTGWEIALMDDHTRSVFSAIWNAKKRYSFQSFYHPYACFFIQQLNRYGLAGLLDPDPSGSESEDAGLFRQQKSAAYFDREFNPNRDVVAPETNDPKDAIDFDFAAAYSQYNWELFFHAPLLIADRLMQNQRFAEAQRWFHYIFDPTIGQETGSTTTARPDSVRFWKVKPFYEAANERFTPEELMLRLNQRNPELEDQVEQWQNDPFNPHLLARLRITAYMKTVVMKYLDNLIAWGDHLFRQDTLETTAEATQVYVLAANILGQRPSILPPRTSPPQTFASLEPRLDAFSNALVTALVATESLTSTLPDPASTDAHLDTASGIPSILYFCIPANDKLLSYWDVVSDRLFKLRHCMNIEGAVRQLPLFEPPIDPALLVRAKAMGVDLRDVIAGGGSLSPYRFNVVLQKANELCAEVKSLGAALLSAYEKRDGEELARIRSEHENQLLDAMRHVKEKQLQESNETYASLNRAKATIKERWDFYRTIEFMNNAESTSLLLGSLSSMLGLLANGMSIGGASAALVPDITIGIAGWAGSPMTIATSGGQQASNAANSWAKAFEMLSSYTNMLASLTGTMGNYRRRWEEWKLQERLAEKENEQIDKQIAAAEIRNQISQKELENHDLQRTNSQAIDEYMRSKFSNQELYNWMVSELSALYFQSYQLAYDTARRAELAYRFERGIADSSFIRFGQWDSLRRGLLAGERLQLDLRRLELASLHEHRREHELTKHISLVSLNPLALIQLKETGSCELEVPEVLFDLDHPGHYMRRLKAVSLTIPCVVGPYTNVNAKLTLLRNTTRINPNLIGDNSYPESLDPTSVEDRFRHDFAPSQSIATSTGQNDSGLFELNFRDERYLPFEGAGAISRWRLELSGNWPEAQWPQFDVQTIADVILHLRYTARDGGENLKTAAIRNLNQAFNQLAAPAEGSESEDQGLLRLFSLRHEFPTEWQRFSQATGSTRSLSFVVTRERFPYFLQGKTLNILKVYSPDPSNPLSPLLDTEVNPSIADLDSMGEPWSLTLNWNRSEVPKDLLVVLRYTIDG